MCISCEISECEGGPCKFGNMDPFQQYIAKTLSSVDSRGKYVDQLVTALQSDQAKHCTKIKKLEKRADKHDTEQVCMVFNTSLSAPGALAHSLQRRAACNIQNGYATRIYDIVCVGTQRAQRTMSHGDSQAWRTF